MTYAYQIQHVKNNVTHITTAATIAACREYVSEAFRDIVARVVPDEAGDYAFLVEGVKARSLRDCGLYSCADMFNEYWRDEKELIYIRRYMV